MKRLLVLGAAGMAGHVVADILQQNSDYQVETSFRKGAGENILNVSDEAAVENFFADRHYDYIINCTGVLVKESNRNPIKAIKINSLFPKTLEQLLSKTGMKIIHISTDCVFSGKTGRYREDAPRDGYDIYAKSKALGEIDNKKDVTIRTSIMGPEIKKNGSGLFHWFMHQSGTVQGFIDHIWSGVTTIELAKFINYIINNPITGLLHLTNNQTITKFEALQIINDIWCNKNISILPFSTGETVDKSLISTRENCAYSVPSYKTMFLEMHEYMIRNITRYSQFYENLS